MSALSRSSPLKRKSAEKPTHGAKPTTLFEVGNHDWPCLDAINCPSGFLKLRNRKSDGKPYVTCDHNSWRDSSTCKVALSMLNASKDHPHPCQLCLQDVGGSPSIGNPTDEKDDRGYTIWENFHGVFSHCAGAKTADGKTFKNATPASGDVVGKGCLCWDGKKNVAKDINLGCTGKIKAGELVVKDWEDPPLHLVCSKREWRKAIDEHLEQKKTYKDLGTTPEKEASQPSAAVPDSLKDF